MSHEIAARTHRIGTSEDIHGLKESDMLLHGGVRYAVIKVGNSFSVVRPYHSEGDHLSQYEIGDIEHGVIYRPVHPDMTLGDIEGATYAEDTGTHWKFYHATPGQHYDWTLNAETTLVALFQSRLSSMLLEAASGTTVTQKSLSSSVAKALIQFRDESKAELRKLAEAATLGFFWKNPSDHTRKFIDTAITNVWKSWQVAPSLADPEKAVQLRARAGRISSIVSSMLTELRRTPKITTPAEQRAAQAAAAAKEDDDD